MFLVAPSQLSKFAVVALVVLSSSACSRLQVGGNSDPNVVEGSVSSTNALYTVQAGDNLYVISKRFGLRYQDIAAWNNISAPYTIQPGQRLTLVPGAAPVVTATTPAAPVVRSQPQELVFDWDTGTVRPVNPSVQVQPVAQTDWQTGQPRTVSPPAIGGVEQALYYTVKSGDTLSIVAKRYGVSYQQLAAWNKLSPPYALKVGQNLLVSAQTVSSLNAMGGMSIVNALPPSTAGTTRYHRVQVGDTLYSIARMYGRTYQEVAAWNGIPVPYQLSVGQSLLVSASASSNSLGMASFSAAPLNGNYQVVKGDTLSSIARRFNHSTKELIAWNNLKKPYSLKIGQNLQVASQAMPMPVASQMSIASVANSQPQIIDPTLGMAKTAAQVQQDAMMATPMLNNNATVRKTLRGEIVYHAVQQGESLAAIASSYGQNMQELALWNGIAPPYSVYPGQTIMVYR